MLSIKMKHFSPSQKNHFYVIFYRTNKDRNPTFLIFCTFSQSYFRSLYFHVFSEVWHLLFTSKDNNKTEDILFHRCFLPSYLEGGRGLVLERTRPGIASEVWKMKNSIKRVSLDEIRTGDPLNANGKSNALPLHYLALTKFLKKICCLFYP